VRLARDFGTIDRLFPPEFRDLNDLPYALADMLHQALTYLGFEEFDADEQPPRRIWEDPRKMREWFKEIRRKRKREVGGSDESDMVQNDAAKALIVG